MMIVSLAFRVYWYNIGTHINHMYPIYLVYYWILMKDVA